MKTEIVIAERNEPDLKETIRNIKANNAVSVRVFSDHAGLGPQFCRDAAIMQSDADVVIVMDGHMRTQYRTLEAMADYVAQKGRTVACLRCHHSETEDWTTKPYGGARLVWTDKDKNGFCQSFVAKWRKTNMAGKIGAVIGACYAMRRDWYIDGLKRPWQHGTGWGCDEEILSAATWLRGGEVELLPWAVWHRARSEGAQPFQYTERQILGVWANRLRLLQVLPMEGDRRERLVKHLASNILGDGEQVHKEKWAAIAKISDESLQWQEEYRAFLNAGGLSWREFCSQVMEKETVKMPV